MSVPEPKIRPSRWYYLLAVLLPAAGAALSFATGATGQWQMP